MTATIPTTCTDTPLHEIIIEVVADCWQVKSEQIKASGRGDRTIGDARHIAAVLMKMYQPKMPLKMIGFILGGRDHSTIIHSLRVTNDLYDTDKDFKLKFDCSKTVIDNILEDGSIENQIITA